MTTIAKQHLVQKGETLTEIAMQEGTSVAEILKDKRNVHLTHQTSSGRTRDAGGNSIYVNDQVFIPEGAQHVFAKPAKGASSLMFKGAHEFLQKGKQDKIPQYKSSTQVVKDLIDGKLHLSTKVTLRREEPTSAVKVAAQHFKDIDFDKDPQAAALLDKYQEEFPPEVTYAYFEGRPAPLREGTPITQDELATIRLGASDKDLAVIDAELKKIQDENATVVSR